MFNRKLAKNILLILLITVIIVNLCDARRKRYPNRRRQPLRKSQKQLEYDSKETNTPNFVRLVIMRLIYGIASQLGIEERLEDTFNGAFVPPNADDGAAGIFGDGFNVLGDGDDDEDGGFGLTDMLGI